MINLRISSGRSKSLRACFWAGPKGQLDAIDTPDTGSGLARLVLSSPSSASDAEACSHDEFSRVSKRPMASVAKAAFAIAV